MSRRFDDGQQWMTFDKPLARRIDPPTSHAAGKAAPVKGHCRLVLDALRHGPAGQTEISIRLGRKLLPHQINKRLSNLKDLGLATPTGREIVNETGRTEREWRVTNG
jgi:hypothetical protein